MPFLLCYLLLLPHGDSISSRNFEMISRGTVPSHAAANIGEALAFFFLWTLASSHWDFHLFFLVDGWGLISLSVALISISLMEMMLSIFSWAFWHLAMLFSEMPPRFFFALCLNGLKKILTFTDSFCISKINLLLKTRFANVTMFSVL